MALSAAIIPATPIMAAAQVNLTLVPAAQIVKAGETFDVVIQAQSGGQEVVGVDAYLDFDFTKLAVVDMNSGTAGIQISAGTTLTMSLWNLADNTAGRIAYSAGAFSPYPSGTFTIATIRFRALAETSPITAVTFSTSFERPTTIVGDIRAADVTGTLTGGTYTLSPDITPPTPSGGDGSSGSDDGKAINTSGLSSLTNLTVNGNGAVQSTTRLTTTNGEASLNIAAGTTLLNSLGNPLSFLTAQAMTTPPAAPAGNALISAYTFGPSGASFNPAIVLSLSYDPLNLPEGVEQTDLYISYYDGTTWVKLESTVDPVTKTVSAKISHFSSYALIGKAAAVTPSAPQSPPAGGTAGLDQPRITPVPTVNPITVQTPAQTVAPTTPAITPSSTPAPQLPLTSNLPLIIGILLVVVVLTVLIVLRRRLTK